MFILTALRYTSYPVTPTLSVEAVQLNVADVAARLDDVNAVGAVGACTSVVVTVIVLLLADTLPAASNAFTKKLYDVAWVRPVTLKLVAVTAVELILTEFLYTS